MKNMTEKLASLIIESLSGLINYPFGKHIIVFLTSIMPVLELRGGLIAAALLNLSPWESYAIAIVANLIPIPFLIYLIGTVIIKMQKSKIGFLKALLHGYVKK